MVEESALVLALIGGLVRLWFAASIDGGGSTDDDGCALVLGSSVGYDFGGDSATDGGYGIKLLLGLMVGGCSSRLLGLLQLGYLSLRFCYWLWAFLLFLGFNFLWICDLFSLERESRISTVDFISLFILFEIC